MTAYTTAEHSEIQDLLDEVDVVLGQEGLCDRGDRLVVVYGSPMGIPGKTNTLHVHRYHPRDSWDPID